MVAVVSLFCGCGGSSLGYKLANCDVKLATDFSSKALENYALNFPDTKTLKQDIRTITGQMIMNLTGIKQGQLDILDGSPPCTPFTVITRHKESSWGKSYKHAGEQTKQITNDLFFEYIRLIKELKPKTFIAENVRGLIVGKAKGYFINITKQLKDLGYDIKVFDINAQDFEVAQSRPRIIIIGIREDIRQNKAVRLKKHGLITFYQAVKGLVLNDKEWKHARDFFLNSSRLQFAIRLKQGRDISNINFSKNNGFNVQRVWLDRPVPTIAAHTHILIHPTENRYLTLSELKRCASYPDSFKFISETEGQVRIGNSVPPNLIKNLAIYLIERASL